MMELINVLPRVARDGRSCGLATDAIFAGQCADAHDSEGMALSDVPHNGLGQLGSSDPFATRRPVGSRAHSGHLAPLAVPIRGVVGLRAEGQMRRIATRRVVANEVPNQNAGRDRAVGHFPSDAMCAVRVAVSRELPIALVGSPLCPRPARVGATRPVHVGPEPRFRTTSLRAIATRLAKATSTVLCAATTRARIFSVRHSLTSFAGRGSATALGVSAPQGFSLPIFYQFCTVTRLRVRSVTT